MNEQNFLPLYEIKAKSALDSNEFDIFEETDDDNSENHDAFENALQIDYNKLRNYIQF